MRYLQYCTVDRRHVPRSIMTNVMWQHFDQSAKQLISGHTTICLLQTPTPNKDNDWPPVRRAAVAGRASCPRQWRDAGTRRWVQERHSPARPWAGDPERCSAWSWMEYSPPVCCHAVSTTAYRTTGYERCYFNMRSKADISQLNLLHRTNNYTRTHPFKLPLSRTTRVNRYQKGRTNLAFIEARDSEWQWHQLGHMQVCTSLQTDNRASTPPLSFLQTGCPSCRPTNSVKALKAK